MVGKIFQIVLLVLLAMAVLLVALNFGKLRERFRQLKVFFEEVSFEMGKVTWPSQDEVINSTILVGILTIMLTIMVMIVDRIFSQLARWLII